MSNAKRWVFTLNNYTEDDEQKLFGDFFETNGDRAVYMVVGREVGDSGTPHLQGFVIFSKLTKLTWLKNHLHARAHFEVARGNNEQASKYCQKDNDFEEFGELPPDKKQGSAAQFEELKEWAKSRESCPSEKEVADKFPHLWCKYRRSVMDMVRMFSPSPDIQGGELRGWQIELKEKLEGEPTERTVIFIVDPEGNKGKSFFVRWMISKYPERVQVLGPARRDDLAHVVDVEKSLFLINVPRGSMEHLNYGFLESLKDRMVLSPKYESTMKILKHLPHVVVFSNEAPDEEKMTSDRYEYFNI